MSEEQKAREGEVFAQELSGEDLEAAAGGTFFLQADSDYNNCVRAATRQIYGADGNSFPNCAATVESGSFCGTNDACMNDAVVYEGIKDRVQCYVSWK